MNGATVLPNQQTASYTSGIKYSITTPLFIVVLTKSQNLIQTRAVSIPLYVLTKYFCEMYFNIVFPSTRWSGRGVFLRTFISETFS
jgi:hypothetical protein